MPIYHTRVKTYSRAKGHASTSAAAYRAGLLIVDTRTGAKHDYRRRGGVVETRCVAPDHAPDWALDPTLLWPAAEDAERRKDATVAREFEIALPHEVTDDQRSALAADIAHALVDRYGFAVQSSIHEPQTRDGLNYHVHILATTRRVGPDGLSDKTRELDGGPSGRGEVEWVREMVAEATNAHLRAAGVNAVVDHRSLRAQADAAAEAGDLDRALELARQPTQHMGKDATALHRKGMDTQRQQANDTIGDANEASWQAALEQFHGEGRLQAVPDGHTHERARRERSTVTETTAVVEEQGDGGILVVGRMPGRLHDRPPAPPRTLAETQRATQDALTEVIALWTSGLTAKINASFKHTAQLVEHGAERLSAFVQMPRFRSDLRELLKRLKRLSHDAQRFARRMAAEERAQHLLLQAEFSLERFDAEHPKPGIWSRSEWSKRRARRLRAVQARRDAHRRARHDTGPEAQERYDKVTQATAEQLENWSEGMLARFPVPADKQVEAAELVEVAAMGESSSIPERGHRPANRPR